jgi:hypothetical protein
MRKRKKLAEQLIANLSASPIGCFFNRQIIGPDTTIVHDDGSKAYRGKFTSG